MVVVAAAAAAAAAVEGMAYRHPPYVIVTYQKVRRV
jgi:hypothetical protein